MSNATIAPPNFSALTPLSSDAALFRIGRLLQENNYHFTTVTPDTHAIFMQRQRGQAAKNLRDIFGWNLPFDPALVSEPILTALHAANAVEASDDDLLRTRIRFSTIGKRIFLHSGYPTHTSDAVFLGPDTYRFMQVLRRTLSGGKRLLEIGAGSGAAALSFADHYQELVLTDINPTAVRYARINAALADCDWAEVMCTDLTTNVPGAFDAIIANPPFIIDPAHRLYRDGGELGISVAVRMVEAALPLLSSDGSMVLYSGTPIIAGRDMLAEALAPLTSQRPVTYEELDVDVFGSELASELYASAEVERIAVVAVHIGHSAHSVHSPVFHHKKFTSGSWS